MALNEPVAAGAARPDADGREKRGMQSGFVCTCDVPVVQIDGGKVRGFIQEGVNTFYGIRFARARRYRRAEPVEPWQGVADAFDFGYVAPLMQREVFRRGPLDVYRYWPESEDCLYANVWSPSLEPAGRKPVMVWIHGGGYTHGSSIASAACEGDELCRCGDVVVVSFNHRLNALGCLDLSEYGEAYRYSGNLVMSDILEGLRWIRRNAAAFGGDPDNITVFGHSSGGAKVSNLLQMPEADGLFHKAIIMTGIIPPQLRVDRETSLARTRAVVRELGLDKSCVQRIETVPLEQLFAACARADAQLRAQGRKPNWGVHPGEGFPGDPLEVGLSQRAREIPIMSGSSFGEHDAYEFPGVERFAPDALRRALREKYGESAGRLTELFREAYPDKPLAELLAVNAHTRVCNLDFMELCAQAGCKNLYAYVFAFDFPFCGGKPAWHGAELPFAFHTARRVPICRAHGADRLADQMASAWVNFARTGDPNGPGAPRWPAYQRDCKATMVFDVESRARVDYDRELVEGVGRAAPFDFG